MRVHQHSTRCKCFYAHMFVILRLVFNSHYSGDVRHARARHHEIAMVMLDLTMPRLDGEQTYAELRRMQSSVRVVLMSGFNQQEAIARFTGKGLASFVQKPFSLETLRVAVQGVLG